MLGGGGMGTGAGGSPGDMGTDRPAPMLRTKNEMTKEEYGEILNPSWEKDAINEAIAKNARASAIFKESFGGATEQIKAQQKELRILNIDLEDYRANLARLEAIQAAGGQVDQWSDVEKLVEGARQKVGEYDNYVKITTDHIEKLNAEHREGLAMAERAKVLAEQQAKARASAPPDDDFYPDPPSDPDDYYESGPMDSRPLPPPPDYDAPDDAYDRIEPPEDNVDDLAKEKKIQLELDSIERERLMNRAKINGTSDDEIAAQRKIIAIEQQRLATEVRIQQIGTAQNMELAQASARQRDIAVNAAKIANSQDEAAEATRKEAAQLAIRQRAEDNIASLKKSSEPGSLRLIQLEEGYLKEKLAITTRLATLQNNDPELKIEQQKLKTLEQQRDLEYQINALGNEKTQKLRSEVAIENERLEIIDKIAEIEAGGAGGEFGQLKEKLRLLEQEKDLKNEIQELARKADNGNLRELQDMKVLADTTKDFADEQVRLNHILSNPAALQRAKQLHAMEEQLERSTRTWREKVEFVADILEKTDSSLQVWFTIGMVAETAFKVFTEGAIARGIQEATAALGEFNSEVQISANAGGLMTKTQARQASLRGSELGLGRQAQGQLAGYAATLGQRSVALGDSSDVTEATIESMRSLQQELRDGELGQGFKDLGVSVGQYDQAIRRAAAQKGVLPEALDRQTKQQILLAQATNDHTSALALYGNEALRSSAQIKNTFSEVKAGLGSLIAGNSPVTAFGDSFSKSAAGQNVARLESELAVLRREAESSQKYYGKEQIEADKSRPAWERGGGASRNDASENAEMARVEAELSAARELELLQASAILTKQINQDLELKSETILLTGAEGARQLLILNDVLRLEKQRRDVGDLNSEEAQRLYNETEKLLGTSKLIDREWLNQLSSRVTISDLGRIINEQGAVQLSAATKTADAEAKAAKHRLDNTKIMSGAARLEQTRLLAATEFKAELFKELELQGKTFDEAQAYLNNAKVQNMIRLEGEKAINTEKIKYSKLITGEQKQILETRNLVTDLKLETLGLTTNAAAYHATVGQAVAVKAFEKWGGGAKALAEQFGIGDEALGKMVQKAGELAGIVDLIAGGGIFTDNFLEKLFAPGKDTKDPTGIGTKDKGAGRSKEDDGLLEQLRRERIARYIEEQSRYHEVRRHYDDAATSLDEAFTDLHITEEQKRHEASLTSLGNTGKEFRKLYGEGGTFSKELDAALMELEWWHLDTEKRAGKNKEKLAAVEQAWREKMTMMAKDQLDRQAEYVKGHYETIKTAALQYADEIAAKWQEKLDAAAADARAAQEDNMFAGSRVGLLGGSLFQASGGEDAEARLGASAGERAMSAAEVAKIKEHSLLTKTYNEKIESTFYNEQQIANIKAKFLRESSQLEIDLMRLGFEESSRLRQEQVASYEAMLAETQELMSHFAEEARSTAEAGKATFKGGLSDTGDSIALSADIGMATGIGFLNVIDQIDKAQVQYTENRKKMNGADQEGYGAIMKGVGGVIGAAGKAADGIIKNERYKAGIKGAVHTAEAIGDYASGNILGGTMHALAAAKFFAIAATATGGGGAAEAKKNEATKRTALSNNTVAFSRDRGPSVMMQVFIELQPLTGKSIVKTMNRDAPSSRGVALDGRWTRPTASVRTDV